MVWRHLLASDPALVPSSARTVNYAPDNGQVFTETTFSMPASMLSSWTTTTIGSLYDVTNFKNRDAPGADSLEQMALRSILANLNDLDVETLSCVPWTVGRKIWHYIMRVRLDSLRTWKMFVCAYPEARDVFNSKTHKVSLSDTTQRFTLPNIVKQISAPDFEWINHLSLKDAGSISTAEWTSLAKLPNLGTLQVIGTEVTNLNDRVLRAWSDEAQSNGAFPELRVVMLLNIMSISNASFQHLHRLPSLRLCTLDGCDISYDSRAEPRGWKAVPATAHKLIACGLIFTHRDSPDDYYRRTFSSDYTLPPTASPHEPPALALRCNLAGHSYRLYTCPLLERVELPSAPTASAPMGFTPTTSTPTAAASAPVGVVSVGPVPAAEAGPETKKRKLRDARSLRLEDVLGAFGA